MNVKELIEALNKVKNKNIPVMFFCEDCNSRIFISEIVENDDNVILSEILPDECYEKDYRFER